MVFWELACAMSAAGAPQAPKREPFGLKYELRPGLQIITFHTQQGQVRVTLPDLILAGQAFSGTAEAILEGASTATSIYIVELGQQQAVVKDRALRFTAPAEAGLVPLILRDFREDEIARFALAISSRDAAPRGAGGKWRGDGFWVPDLIESTAAIPLLGPFDGNSATTGFKLGGVVCEAVTEVPGRAMAQCRDFRGAPTVKPGVVRYEITKSGTKAEGETRAVALQLSGVPTELANGKFVKMRLVLSGLAGIARDAEIKIENFTPTVVILDRDPPINYFPHNLEHFFIHPKDVKADGTYVTERSLMGIQHGDPIEIRANLVIPTTPHEAVEQILRTPRINFSKYPGVEHTEALAPFGNDMFPLVAEFLTDGELAWAAEDVLLADRAKAAPLVFAAIPKMSGQPLGIAMETYRRWAQEDSAFPYKRELHDAARDLLERGGGGTEAIFALAAVGTGADMPALEKVYQEQKALEAEGKATTSS